MNQHIAPTECTLVGRIVDRARREFGDINGLVLRGDLLAVHHDHKLDLQGILETDPDTFRRYVFNISSRNWQPSRAYPEREASVTQAQL